MNEDFLKFAGPFAKTVIPYLTDELLKEYLEVVKGNTPHIAIANPVKGPDGGMVYATYVGFLKHFTLPNAHIFNVLVPWGEFLVGLGLILGCLTTAAVFFGLVMNFAYMMAGTVSTNPWDILLGVFILAAGLNAGRVGLDRWLIPDIRKYAAIGKKENHADKHTI